MIEKRLKTLGIFQNCTDDFFKKIVLESSEKSYNKGHILFLHEDPAERFYLINHGWIKLFRETLDGTQAVIDILTTDHIFGETAIFEDNLYPYSAEIVEPASIISMPIAVLKQEIETNNKLAYDMLNNMSSHRRQQDREIEHRSLQNASQRIGCFILRLTQQTENGTTCIQLPYDKMLVASRLGMQPETFSRALNKLKEKTGIRISGATIEFDHLEQLSNYSCTACSSEFPCKDLSMQNTY